jgi:hypothetical protein
MYKEIDIAGIYLPPLLVCLVVAGVFYVPIHHAFNRMAMHHKVWNQPIFEMALFTLLLGMVIYVL